MQNEGIHLQYESGIAVPSQEYLYRYNKWKIPIKR